jgi:hypothetical protein
MFREHQAPAQEKREREEKKRKAAETEELFQQTQTLTLTQAGRIGNRRQLKTGTKKKKSQAKPQSPFFPLETKKGTHTVLYFSSSLPKPVWLRVRSRTVLLCAGGTSPSKVDGDLLSPARLLAYWASKKAPEGE